MANKTEGRKRELINEILGGNDSLGFDIFRTNMKRAEELQSLYDNGTTVDIILERLLSRKASGNLKFFSVSSPVYFLLTIVEKLASSRHATRIAEILSWDELVRGDDRTYRTLVLEILEKIGDRSIVPALENFGKKVRGIAYTDYIDCTNGNITPAAKYNKMDRDCVAQAIKACQAR